MNGIVQKWFHCINNGSKDKNRPGQRGSVGWGILLCTKMLWVCFPVRAHAWVAGSVPCWGASETTN